MHENLWAGVGLKVEHGRFFLPLDRPREQRVGVVEATDAIVDTQWQSAFYANLDAFLG